MSTRDFFRNKKVITSTNLEQQFDDVESSANAEAKIVEKNRFIPQIDFTSASNFAYFGSAEEYYTRAMTNIADRWPFDGSQKEQTEFLNSSSYIDLYVFENLYPRTNGYIQIAAEDADATPGSGITPSPGSATTFGLTELPSYITFSGSLHTASGGMSGKSLATTFTGSNIYEEDIYTDAGVQALGRKGTRTSNLLYDLPGHGLAIEFWSQGFDTSREAVGKAICLYDMWNGEASSSAQYGRLTLFASNSAGTSNPSIFLNAYSGTVGVQDLEILPSSLLDTNSWNHYAFVLSSGSAQGLTVESYLNSALNITTGSSIALNEVTGAMRGRIGALLTNPSGNSPTLDLSGYGQTIKYLYDEFRYWKAERTADQIAKNYWTQVRGGTNTDLANTTLGVYFKFNEGITDTASIDSKVLDYSGRISDGTIFNLFSPSVDGTRRFVGSAIVSASAATSEFKDPIIYKEHPDYISLYDSLELSGTVHDDQNTSYLYRTLPGWIMEDDENLGSSELKYLMHIMGNTFDNIYLQTKEYSKVQNVDYGVDVALSGTISGSKPFTHNDRILQSYGFDTDDVFIEQTFLEYFSGRDNNMEFEQDLTEVKNQIYRNIYNNLVYLYKSKGTEKSIRNLLRCIGLPRNVVNLNAYSNNNTYLIEDRYQDNTGKKKYINFYNTASFDATVFQKATSNANARSRDVVANTFGSDNVGPGEYSGDGGAFNPITIEANIILPKLKQLGDPGYFDMNFQTASIFTLASASNGIYTQPWTSDLHDYRLEVQVIRPDVNSNDAYFKLIGIGPSPNNAFGEDDQILTSSIFKNAYDNNEWTLALTIAPSDQVRFMSSGSSALPGQPTQLSNANTSPEPPIKATLIGYNTEGSYIKNSFEFTHAYSDADSDILGAMLASTSRVSAGAKRTNYSGSVVTQTNIKLGHLRRFNTKLSKEAIKNHAIDRNNFGTERPQRNQFLFADTSVGVQDAYIPDINSLEFNVDFQTVTGSDSSGEFTTVDYSSGSVVVSEDLRNNYPAVGAMYATQYEFLGTGFPTSETTTVVNTDLLLSSDLQLPEAVNSSDMVSVLSRDDELFTRDPAVFNMNFALEKSYNQVISGQMVDFFGGIIAFNDLLGDVGNKYRSDYDQLEVLRALFFDKIENLTDFNQFYEFYKWIDDSIINFVRQLVPASANFENNVRNLVEQHILERNKVKYQYPYLDYRGNARFTEPTFQATVQGVKQLVYNWRFGHAPVGSTDELTNQTWWSQQAKSTDGNSSGDATIDAQRQNIDNQKTGVNAKKVVTFRDNTGSKYYRPLISRNGTVQTLDLNADVDDTVIQSGRNTDFNKNPNVIRTLVNDYDPKVDTKDNIVAQATSEHLVQGGSIQDGPAAELFTKYSNDDAPVNPVENYEPNLKRKLPRYLTHISPVGTSGPVNETDGFLTTNIEDLFVGTIRSSSVTTGYGAHLNVSASLPAGAGGVPNPTFDITNIHLDTVYDNDIPMQGPFAEAHVGGYQYRHQDLNQGLTLDTSDTRAEGWKIAKNFNPHTYGFVQAFSIVPGQAYDNARQASDSPFTRPFAIHIRDEYAKRPVNIRNIKYTTGSQVLGNYQHDYSLMLLSGRYTNNHVFAYNDGFGTASIPSTFVVDGLTDYAKPDRFRASGTTLPTQYSPSTQHVLVQRFSAPGDVTTAGDNQGGPGLDFIAAEFAPNNSINFRNMTVRQPFNRVLLVDHMNYGGFFSDENDNGTSIYNPSTITATTYLGSASEGGIGAGTASLHKYNRNPRKVVNQATSADFISNITTTKFVYDNAYISTNIPNSDVQYAWITASIDFTHAVNPTRFLNYAPADGMVSTSVGLQPAFSFVSASELGSAQAATNTTRQPKNLGGSYRAGTFTPTDFIGINSTVVEPVSASEFTVGYPLNTDVFNYYNFGALGTFPGFGSAFAGGYITRINVLAIAIASAGTLNHLLTHRGDRGTYATWNQIRVGQSQLARLYRNNNLYTYTPQEPTLLNVPVTIGGTTTIIQIMDTNRDSKSFTQSPVTSKFKPATVVFDTPISNDRVQRTRLLAEHGNDINYLSNPANEIAFQLGKVDLLEPTPLDLVTNLYSSDPTSFIAKQLIYSERVWPTQENAYLNISRGRTKFINNFWRNDKNDRQTLGNSQKNESITDAFGYARSSWNMDVYPAFETDQFASEWQDGIPSPSIVTTGTYGNAGILQNYTTFNRFNTVAQANGDPSLINAQPTYNRPHFAQTLRAVASPFGMDILLSDGTNLRSIDPGQSALGTDRFNDSFLGSGQAKWQAADQAGAFVQQSSSDGTVSKTFVVEPRTPFYDSYDEYSADIRVKGKDYAIIPEYRTSDFINFTAEDSSDIFEIPDIFRIVQDISSSNKITMGGIDILTSTPQNSSQETFYKTFSNSDFLRYFSIVKDKNEGLLDDDRLTLKCKAIKKFLPYNGFYPAERTTDIAKQFFNTYNDNISVSDGTTAASASVTNEKRPVMQTMFAPGILYNAIKAGVAVDYPIYTDDYNTAARRWSAGSSAGEGFVALSSSFNKRVPFEAIYEPAAHLNGTIVDNEPLVRTIIGGIFTPGTSAGRLANEVELTPNETQYNRMVNNFLAETQNFFIRGGRPTRILSAPEEQFSTVSPGKPYGMRIKMYRSKNRPHPVSGAYGNYPVPQNQTSSFSESPTAFIYLNRGMSDNIRGFTPDTNWPTEAVAGVTFAFNSSAGVFTVSGSSEHAQGSSFVSTDPHNFLITTGTVPGGTNSSIFMGLLADAINLSSGSVSGTYQATYLGSTEINNVDGYDIPVANIYDVVKVQATNPSMTSISLTVTNTTNPAAPLGGGDNIDDFFFISDNLLTNFASGHKLSTGNMATGRGDGAGDFATDVSLTPKETLTMYSRPTAFGPPSAGTQPESLSIEYSGAYDSGNGFNMPFTPPYYDGEAWMDIIYVPYGSSISGSVSSSLAIPGGYRPSLDSSNLNYDSLFTFPNDEATEYATRADGIFIKHWRFDEEAGDNPGTDLLARDGNLNINAMNLSASIDAFKIVTDAQGRRRWAIDLKFETPILNFSHLSSSSDVFYPDGELSGSVPRGMWHQFGRIPSDNEGVYLQVGPIPQKWLDNHPRGLIGNANVRGGIGIDAVGRAYSILPFGKTNDADNMVQPDGDTDDGETLDKICGFSTEPVKIGQLRKKKKIREAIVAVPFVEVNGTRNFFEMPRDRVDLIADIVAKELDQDPETREFALEISGFSATLTDEQKQQLRSTSTGQQIRKMSRYNFPPQFDFLRFPEITPISMYIFEFTHTFSEDDLSHMWQNVSPKIGRQMEEATATISHPLMSDELLGNFALGDRLNNQYDDLPENLQWMVFKVKQKALTDYKKLTGKGQLNEVPTFNYNWPYDQFSLVELAQIEANISLADERRTPLTNENGDPVITRDGDPISSGEQETLEDLFPEFFGDD